LEECASHLYHRKEIMHNFIKMNGITFYQRDRENMQRYPPHYGLHRSPSKNKEEQKQMKDMMMET
jgi:hypothetical protein